MAQSKTKHLNFFEFAIVPKTERKTLMHNLPEKLYVWVEKRMRIPCVFIYTTFDKGYALAKLQKNHLIIYQNTLGFFYNQPKFTYQSILVMSDFLKINILKYLWYIKHLTNWYYTLIQSVSQLW